jgi:hypothetical protein
MAGVKIVIGRGSESPAMKVKIFSCHHETPHHVFATPLFQTLVSNIAAPPGALFLSDLAGSNIASREKFSEMRHQYHVWQSLAAQYDYVGFEHYRRLLHIDPLPAAALARLYPGLANIRRDLALNPHQSSVVIDDMTSFEHIAAMRSQFDEAEENFVKQWLLSYDIIYTMPLYMPVSQNFKLCHPEAAHYWDAMLAQFTASRAYSGFTTCLGMPPAWSGHLNMYIMRTELFIDYMDLIFPVLLALDDRFPEAPRRIWGHMAERLLGAFILHKALENPLLRFRPLPNIVFPKPPAPLLLGLQN